MLYVIALAATLAVLALLWRAFRTPNTVIRPPSRRPIAPDDDPEFLRRLAEKNKRTDENGSNER